jgi:flavin reductase (DIM6/NTAB) family NADH-FMN oxidoreductase RutF
VPPALADAAAVDLRRAFRPAASSVWVVTSAHDGVPVGFTAISIVSVSLNPPLVSFNVGLGSSSLATLQASQRFAAHLLGADQLDLADRFAAAASQRFTAPTTWTWDDTGVPALENVLVRVAGRIRSTVPAGDSLLVIGEVEQVRTGAERGPLLHHDRAYRPVPLAPVDRRTPVPLLATSGASS